MQSQPMHTRLQHSRSGEKKSQHPAGELRQRSQIRATSAGTCTLSACKLAARTGEQETCPWAAQLGGQEQHTWERGWGILSQAAGLSAMPQP